VYTQYTLGGVYPGSVYLPICPPCMPG